jgi:hypothetical protein
MQLKRHLSLYSVLWRNSVTHREGGDFGQMKVGPKTKMAKTVPSIILRS